MNPEPYLKTIYPLSFHVTYWDYIGWKDPYGNEEFSKRQERYAKAIPTRLYTPQVVLNGSRDYVGSNRSAIFYSLDASLQERKEQEAKYILNLKSKLSSDSVEVSYSLPCSLENLELQFALVEKGITNSVKRGENSSCELPSTQVDIFLQNFEISSDISCICLPRKSLFPMLCYLLVYFVYFPFFPSKRLTLRAP
ncbi:MAG: hypothetical protein CK427_01620 [Leptospira sp.]|nr:MAG: hypothetical protein CK427_01620 [Leptospira sp.]